MATLNDVPEDVYHKVISKYLDYNSRVNFNLALPRLWRGSQKFKTDPNWHDRRITVNRFADYTENSLNNPYDYRSFLRFFKFLLSDRACKLVEMSVDLHDVLLRKSDEFIREINRMRFSEAEEELKRDLIKYSEAVKANAHTIKPCKTVWKTKLIQII